MVLLRLTVKVAPRALEGEKSEELPKYSSFLMVIHRPEQMSLGELGWRVTEQWKKLRPEAEPLKIKKLLDDDHDSDELDADLSVADVFIDSGKAYADGLDQRGVLRVLQLPTSTRSSRYGSVVQDWDTITEHYSRASTRIGKGPHLSFPALNGIDPVSPVKPHTTAANGEVPFEIAESVHPLCSIEEEATNTDTNRRTEPSPALGEREPTQDTADTAGSKPRSSPLDVLPKSARVSKYSLSKQSQKGGNAPASTLAVEIRTSLDSQQAAIRNPAEAKPPSVVDSRPSRSISRRREHYAKRPRVVDSDEASDHTAADTTKRTRSKRAKRQKIAETPVPEPEDDGMEDVQHTEANTEKQAAPAPQADLQLEKENLEQTNAVSDGVRPNSREAMMEKLTGTPAVVDLTSTQSASGGTKSKPKSYQIGLGITASPPKKRTVDKLDIRKDNADTSLTPKTPSRLNRPRSSGVRQPSIDSPMSRAGTDGFHDIPFAPPSTKSEKEKKAKGNENAKPKKGAKRSKKASRNAKKRSNIHIPNSSDDGDKHWSDKFDCFQPDCNFEQLIAELENTIQAAKTADKTQAQILKMEKLLGEIALFQSSVVANEPASSRAATRKRIRRSLGALNALEEPELDWEVSDENDGDGDVNMAYGPPEASSGYQESDDEDGVQAKAPSSSAESYHEVTDDETRTAFGKDEKEDEEEHEDENEEEEENEAEENLEKEEDEDEDEEKEDVETRARASPSLSDATNEAATKRPRRSARKKTRDESPSVYSASVSGSDAPEPEAENSGSDNESVSGDENAIPRSTASPTHSSRQASSAPSQSNESESVEQSGEKPEVRATTPSEANTDADVKPPGTQEEVSSSSEEDEDESNEKIGKEEDKLQESESTSSEGSSSEDEDEDEDGDAVKAKGPLQKRAAKNQVSVFEDTDSDSSDTSKGSDIYHKKIDSNNNSPVQRPNQRNKPRIPPLQKKTHILKRSQTPIHKPLRPSTGSGSASKRNLASSPLVEDKSAKSEFTTFSQPAPTSKWASPRETNGTNPQPTPSRSASRRGFGLKSLLSGNYGIDMFAGRKM